MSESILPHVSLVEHGVLGTQLTADKKLVQIAPEPDASKAIVDPAGLPFLQVHGPSKAKGASGAIYDWLGTKADGAFPDKVRGAIKAAGQAKFYRYGDHFVIHVVGPNLHLLQGLGPETVEAALGKLAEAYGNVLKEYASCPASKLRILPISGGIFAGRFSEDIAWMTFAALQRGFAALLPELRAELLEGFEKSGNLELCIFGAGALPEFADGLASGGAVPRSGPKFLSMLWPGALAKVDSLASEKALHFNGTLCTVMEMQRDEKYLVELDNGSKANIPLSNLTISEAGALVPGVQAIITGLVKEEAKKYNDGKALLKAWSKEHSKWIVKLPDGKTANLPAANLRVAPADTEGEYPIDLF